MTRFRLWPLFITVNEGHGPVNFAVGWICGMFFWYVYAFGLRWHKKKR